jgi:hypothetical protein
MIGGLAARYALSHEVSEVECTRVAIGDQRSGMAERSLRPPNTLYDNNVRYPRLKVRSSERFLLPMAKDPVGERFWAIRPPIICSFNQYRVFQVTINQ